MIIMVPPEFQAEVAEAIDACAAMDLRMQSITMIRETPSKCVFACRPESARSHLDDKIVFVDRKTKP